MAFSSGTFSLYSPGNPVVTGTTISSSWANNTLNDIATGLSTCILKDGTQTLTANITFSGFRLTNLGAATARSDAARTSQVQDSSTIYVANVTGTNTVTGSCTPAITAYVTGQQFVYLPAATNTGATTLNVNSAGAGAVQLNGIALAGGETRANLPVKVAVVTSTPVFEIIGGAAQAPALTGICEGRLTLTSGTAVTTGDVTAATTVYFTPYKGNKITLFNSAGYPQLYTFAETSVAVATTSGTMYDVFAFATTSGGSAVGIEILSWTNDTTRATALATTAGMYTKTGDSTRLYVGSFRTTTGASGQTEDSVARRFVWNYYNRARRQMQVVEATNSWTYTTATWRQANGSTANQLDYVQGVSEDAVEAWATGIASNGNASASSVTLRSGVGVDSTSAPSGIFGPIQATASNSHYQVTSSYRGFPGIGRHFLAWLEWSTAADTTTWYGDNGGTDEQSGITGNLLG